MASAVSIEEMTTEYNEVTNRFNEHKNRISDLIEFEDFDNLQSYDIMRLKELSTQKRILFWKIRCAEISTRINEIKKAHPDEDYPREYYELCARKWESWDNQLRLEKSEWEYLRYHKPVIEQKLMTIRSMMRRRNA